MCRTMGAVPGAKTIKIAIEDPTEKDMELMHITPDKKDSRIGTYSLCR